MIPIPGLIFIDKLSEKSMRLVNSTREKVKKAGITLFRPPPIVLRKKGKLLCSIPLWLDIVVTINLLLRKVKKMRALERKFSQRRKIFLNKISTR